MKLSEIATNDFVKALIYGDSGSGKTVMAASFPGPIEYWDFDGKVSSAAQFYKNDKAKLDSINVTSFNKFPKETRIAEWEKKAREVDAAKKSGTLPFKTLVLDSLTTFSNSMLDDYIHRSQRGIKRALADIPAMQDYQLLDKHLTQIISGLLALDCHVVMIGHMQVEKDESTGVILRQPLMAGKFAAKLPIYFDEVYVSKVTSSGQYVLQTQSDGTYKCRTQRGLPKEIPTSFDSIIKNTK